jgi:2-(1,2-epoxy-1,2-dihydrophenyl)acetyl-CoA isomerase
MSAPTIELAARGSIVIITLNRPEQANTLSLRMAMDLLAAAMACERDTAARAVVLTGAGKSFCFGGDLRGMIEEGGQVEAYLRELTSYLHSAVSHFVRMDAPVIAAVNGTAAGAGLGLVAMADLAIAAQGARFVSAYTGVALTPDAATSFFLPRIIGAKRAMELILTNRSLSAAEALEWGLVNQVVADGAALDAAIALAQRLASGPMGAFGKSKQLLAGSNGALEAQLVLESQTIARQAVTDEGQEGISAFLGKRKPHFTGP